MPCCHRRLTRAQLVSGATLGPYFTGVPWPHAFRLRCRFAARNLIATDGETFTLLLICWNPGRYRCAHSSYLQAGALPIQLVCVVVMFFPCPPPPGSLLLEGSVARVTPRARRMYGCRRLLFAFLRHVFSPKMFVTPAMSILCACAALYAVPSTTTLATAAGCA